MQLNSVDNVSFGRIGFVDKSVKKAFYKSIDNPRFTNLGGKDISLSKWLIEKENSRHDRLLKIGMKQEKGKDYFTNAVTDEVLGTTKRGRQKLSDFLIDLISSANK